VQPPLSFDLARAGHLLVIGGPGSGRSQTLRTFVATAAAQLSPDALHVYAVDCGDGALRALRLLPHLGALVARTEGERTDRLLRRLLAELDRRQRAIADGTATVVGQPGAVACARLAQVLVVIDRWEGFVATSAERDHGAPVEAVVRLLREGASAGLHLLITGDRSLAAGRLSGLCDEALVLRLPDPTDYALVGIDPRRVPAAVPPGRGFTGRGAVEVQVAVLSDGVDCAAGATDTDTDAFAAIAAAAPTPGPAGPFRVDALPPSVRFEAAWRLHRRRPGRLVALAGVGGDQLAALGPDLTDVPGFGIAGPPGSGRSTLLACLAVSALRQGAGILVGAPRPSPIRRLAGRPGVVDVIDAAGTVAERWWAALAAATSDRPVVVVVDDAELFRDTPAATVFAELLRRRDPATPLVVAGRADGLASLTGWPAELRQMRRGAALAVHSPVDAEVLGVRPARSLLDATGRPGRALVHLGDGVARLVTVPYDPLQDASGPAVAET
jgi:S-DNA-T family DNA segregation ATPase FtsK/SpoIIIE